MTTHRAAVAFLAFTAAFVVWHLALWFNKTSPDEGVAWFVRVGQTLLASL